MRKAAIAAALLLGAAVTIPAWQERGSEAPAANGVALAASGEPVPLDRLSVAPGDSLRQGDPVGATGSDPARLIIELRQQDRPVDIASIVR